MMRLLALLLLAALVAGCSLLPALIECPDPTQVSEAACRRSVQAAQAALPADHPAFTRISVFEGCRPTTTALCPASLVNARLVIVFYPESGPEMTVFVARRGGRAVFGGTPLPTTTN